MKDGKQVATMKAEDAVRCVAASRDGRWIAAGSGSFFWPNKSGVIVWDATTYEQVFAYRTGSNVTDIDFSPDSTRLVSGQDNGTAIIRDLAAHRSVRTLSHPGEHLYSARYSPQGDRIATASDESVRVWDSNDGRLLVDIKVRVAGSRCLIWCKNNLFVLTKDSTIKEIDAATRSTVSEWSVPGAQSVALPPHGKFIACSAEKTITFWDTTTHSQLNLIRHTHGIDSIACSSDGRFFAIVDRTRVIVKELFSPVLVSSMLCLQSILAASHFRHSFQEPELQKLSSVQSCLVSVRLCPVNPFFYIFVLQEPELDIDSVALNAWKRGQLANAEALLSAAMPTWKNRHHVLASRALVLARLGQCEAALVDAIEVHVASFSHTRMLTLF